MKNKQNFKILYLFLLLLFVFSCSKKTECPGFPDEYIGYIPYKLGDILSFTNFEDTIHIKIISYDKDEGSTFESSCGYSCCASVFKVKSNFVQFVNDDFFFIGDNVPSTNSSSFIYDMGGNDDFIFGFENEELYFWNYEEPKVIDSLYINKTLYQYIFDLEIDTMPRQSVTWAPPKIWKMLFVKDVGIIKFYDFETKEEWELIP
jgi:hypothetical protein